jgi:hypothetical protein
MLNVACLDRDAPVGGSSMNQGVYQLIGEGRSAVALDPPAEVVQFLQFIGVDWPVINEDSVRDVAGFIREFMDDLQQSHQDATATISAMGDVYQGTSYQLLAQRWAQMSATHMTDLLDACHAVVAALYAAADYIVGMKATAITELIVLAAVFAADQAAAVATLGLAETAAVAVDEAAEHLVDFLEEQLMQHILSEVIEAGFKALTPVIERALDRFVFKAADPLGSASVPAGSVGPVAVGTGFQIDPAGLAAHSQALRGHADAAVGHARTLAAKLSGVSFT